jgi:4-aminobutyrate aminotransferase-like enzyme
MYSTFGGNPVSCAHANATIELMKKENTVSFVETIGRRFLERLQVLYEFDCIGDIRGLGLMIGIEIVKDKKSKEPNENLTRIILNKLKDKLILIGVGGVYKNVIRIAPSFRIDEDDINYFIESMIIILKSNSY